MSASNQSRTLTFGLIIMFLASMLPLTITGGTAASIGETTSWNAGTDSCTIAIGASSCSHTFTWPTPLSATPCPGCSEAALTTTSGSTSDQTVLGGQAKDAFFELGTPGQTWTNMPAAITEIFGDLSGQHRILVDWANALSADFVLNCPTASNSATSTLTVQFSTDGVTWTSIAASTINISTAWCQGGVGQSVPIDSGIENLAAFGAQFTIPGGARLNGVFLRIVGQNGGGTGDSPNFTSAYLIVASNPSTVKFFSRIRITSTSATSIGIGADINVIQTGTTTVNWKMSAWICQAGGSGPC